jgi:hypothetical protein
MVGEGPEKTTEDLGQALVRVRRILRASRSVKWAWHLQGSGRRKPPGGIEKGKLMLRQISAFAVGAPGSVRGTRSIKANGDSGATNVLRVFPTSLVQMSGIFARNRQGIVPGCECFPVKLMYKYYGNSLRTSTWMRRPGTGAHFAAVLYRI